MTDRAKLRIGVIPPHGADNPANLALIMVETPAICTSGKKKISADREIQVYWNQHGRKLTICHVFATFDLLHLVLEP